MSNLPGYGDTVVCPYNKCHVILRHRFQTHLVKCARSYPDVQLEVCPFDVTHRFPAAERAAHIEQCPSRGNFDRYMYSVDSDTAPQRPVISAPRARAPPQQDPEEESWDHYNTPTYDPQRYALSAQVLRTPQLLTPAERRRFADAERKRLSELTHPRHQQ